MRPPSRRTDSSLRDVPGRFLLVLGERSALSWVVSQERMAFPPGRSRETAALSAGDLLLLYTTRGCFHNPTRDRGRVIGEATVSSSVRRLDPPVELAGRAFVEGCDIRIHTLAPLGSGVILAEYVESLDAFPNPSAWAMRLRRPLVQLTPHDDRLLRGRLKKFARPAADTRIEYLRWSVD